MEKTNYIVMKLVSAEVVIARLDAETEDDYILEYPMLVNYANDYTTYKTSMFLSSLNPFHTRSNYLPIAKKHIIFVSSIDDDIRDYYELNVTKKAERENSNSLKEFAELLEEFERSSNTSIN